MAADIDAPVNSLPSVGATGNGGAGVQYSGLEPLSSSNATRWLQGWQFEIPPCNNVLQQGGICTTERSFSPGKPTYFSGQAITVEAQVQCSTYANQEELKQFAIQEFERRVFGKISQEIWSGTASRSFITAGATQYSANRWLARSDHASGSPSLINSGNVVLLKEGIAQLEASIKCCQEAGNALIHVPHRVLSYMGADNLLLSPSGARRHTWGGTGVVAECGYAGTGPDTAANGPLAVGGSDQSWIYGTGPLVIHVAADLKGIESVDIEQNDFNVTISGAYAYGWGCCHFAALVDLVP